MNIPPPQHGVDPDVSDAESTTSNAFEGRRLRLSSEVRIGELLVAIGMLSGIAVWYIDARLEPVKLEIKALQERNLQQDLQALEVKREIRDDIKAMREKLERMAEFNPNNPRR